MGAEGISNEVARAINYGAAFAAWGLAEVVKAYCEVPEPNRFQRLFIGKRVLGAVALMGAIFAFLIERSTPGWSWGVLTSRVIITAAGAVALREGWKALPFVGRPAAGTQDSVVQRGETWERAEVVQDKKDAAK